MADAATATTGAEATRWVDTDAGLVELVTRLCDEPAYALDTEFHRERTYHPQVALLQLAWPGGLALVDPLRADMGALRPLLEGPGRAVMHAAGQDLEVLEHASGVIPSELFDTQLAAGFAGYGTPALGVLVERELGVSLPKADRLTDWLRRPLGAEQRLYASSDVLHLLELEERLRTKLTASGRLEWALAECEDLRVRGLGGRDPDEAWWKVKEARQLRGKSIGVAQAVCAWRERRAAEIDQPVRFVLPDLALVGMAQRPPRSQDELRRVRGLDDRHLRGGAARDILAAVDEGLAMPRSELRLPKTAELERDLRPAVGLVSVWVSQLSRDLGIETALLATRADLEALLRGDPEARLANGWRAELVGIPVRRLVDGEAALAFEGRGRLVLEPRNRP